MKKILILLGLTGIFSSISASSVVLSDGTNVDDWRVYTDTAGEITTHDGVLNFSGEGKATGYRLNISDVTDHEFRDWENVMSWNIKYSENFTIYVRLTTEQGVRYIVYTPRGYDRGMSGELIKIGLGAPEDILDGEWHRVIRHLSEDLTKFDPNNKIISIDSFLVRGSGEIDNLQLGDNELENVSKWNPYSEDAEDGNIDGWRIYSGDTNQATITNAYDADRGSRVIKLDGQGKATGYRFDNNSARAIYHSGSDIDMCWSMKASEDYTVYLRVETPDGRKYITYTPRDDNRGVSGNSVRMGLGANSTDGRWHEYCVRPGAILSSYFGDDKGYMRDSWIRTIFIRGSVSIDDIYSSPEG
ncbi:MAG: hypothetical protein GXO60_01870 [Epsilonproteobacteria bacterium]|nr:hypothetical protein [Campylobacterota bacterium]